MGADKAPPKKRNAAKEDPGEKGGLRKKAPVGKVPAKKRAAGGKS